MRVCYNVYISNDIAVNLTGKALQKIILTNIENAITYLINETLACVDFGECIYRIKTIKKILLIDKSE
jgi:hypothetical protein